MAKERGLCRAREETRRAARLVGWMEGRGSRPQPALAVLANSRRLLIQRPAARRRMLSNEEVACGVAPDGRGRWAVDQIVAWRGGAANRAALVKWCGFDPDTGEPWEDSWEPRCNLTRDLRSGGLLRRRRARDDQQRSQQEDQQQRQRVVGSRKSPRLAGEVPGRAMGELCRPWSCIVLCTGILGGWYLGVGRGAARRCFKLS